MTCSSFSMTTLNLLRKGNIIHNGRDRSLFLLRVDLLFINGSRTVSYTHLFIPGIKPGKKTAEYIDDIMSRITLLGCLFLALVCLLYTSRCV